uniref:C2H2-type domain-containing protein n=1 Tax=Timema genevievae TaxID=629358 RepID=A0A7R9PKC9_TIMGE|nr:unnamed protein product [Timema genevievae]
MVPTIKRKGEGSPRKKAIPTYQRKKIIEELHNNVCSSALDICEVVAVECNEFGNESCYETKRSHDEKIQCEIGTVCYRNIFPTTENSSEEDTNDSDDNYAGSILGNHEDHRVSTLHVQVEPTSLFNTDNSSVDLELLLSCSTIDRKIQPNLSKFLKQTKQLNSLFGTEYDVNDSRLFYGHEEPEYLMSNGRNVAGLDVSDRKFLCTNCTKSYKHKHHLLRHLRLECGVEPNSPDQDLNFNLLVLGNLAQHETSALANYTTEAGCERAAVDRGARQLANMSQFLKANKHSDVFFETEYIVEDSRLVSNHEEQDYFMQGRRTIRAANVSERKFVCPNCTKSYKYKHDLLRHLRLECGVEPKRLDLSKFLRGTKHSFGLFGTEYGADNSQSLFTQTERELLMRRRRNVVELNDLGQKFVCPNCTKSYKHKHHLLRHLRLECGVEPKYPKTGHLVNWLEPSPIGQQVQSNRKILMSGSLNLYSGQSQWELIMTAWSVPEVLDSVLLLTHCEIVLLKTTQLKGILPKNTANSNRRTHWPHLAHSLDSTEMRPAQ